MERNCERLYGHQSHWYDTTATGLEHPAVPGRIEDGAEPEGWNGKQLCLGLGPLLDPNAESGATTVRCAFVNRERAIWAVVSEKKPTPQGSDGTWHLVRLTPHGKAKMIFTLPWSFDPAGDSDIPEIVALADYDGDGQNEAVTRRSVVTDASANFYYEVHLWAVRNGKVIVYRALDHDITGLVDADNDGLPDLVYDPYPQALTVGSNFGWLRGKDPWSLLAHAVGDGTFARDDAVAVQYARDLCAASPELPGAFELRPDCWTGILHCANLWRVERAEDAAMKRCSGASSEAAEWCDSSLGAWQEMLRTKLPLELSEK